MRRRMVFKFAPFQCGEVGAIEVRTCPEVTGTSRRMERPMVDLPLPDSPTSPSTSPRLISKLTSLTALTGFPCPGKPGAQVAHPDQWLGSPRTRWFAGIGESPPAILV